MPHTISTHLPGIFQSLAAATVAGFCYPCVIPAWTATFHTQPPQWVESTFPNVIASVIVLGIIVYHSFNTDKRYSRMRVITIATILCLLGCISGYSFANYSRGASNGLELKQTLTSKSDDTPFTISLPSTQLTSLPGYALTSNPILPSQLRQGTVVAGGASVRLVLQAKDSNQIISVDKVTLKIVDLSLSDPFVFNYTVEPRNQPGFGTSRPHRFSVRLNDVRKPDILFFPDIGQAERVELGNILAHSAIPILLLDIKSGLQESLDFDIVAPRAGIYMFTFEVHATSNGKDYEHESSPFYIVRK